MYGSNLGWSVLLGEPSGHSNESRELRKIEGGNKYALMTPSQIGIARLDAARVVVLEGTEEWAETNSRGKMRASARTHERGAEKRRE